EIKMKDRLMKQLIYTITIDKLYAYLVEHGEQKFRAKQVWDWLYKKRINEFSEMKNLNQSTIDLLTENFNINTMEVQLKQESEDGTNKYLFKLHHDTLIDKLLMRFDDVLSV